MNPHRRSGSKSPLTTLLLLALAAVLTYFYFLAPPDAADTETPPALSAPALPAAPPDAATALKDLLGSEPSPGAGVLFERDFKLGYRHYHVAFVKTRAVDDGGRVEDCHACGAEVGAITYQWTGRLWQPDSKQPAIVTLGAWGDLTLTQPPELLELSPDNVAFTLDSNYTNQGINSGGKHLIGFSGKEWRDLGQLETSGDNGGACDPEADPKDPAGAGPCWEFTGVVSVDSAPGGDYPDLLVIRSGTVPAADGASVVPALNVTYVFDGKQYVAKPN